jgi:ketosteroid isomerase-like protein
MHRLLGLALVASFALGQASPPKEMLAVETEFWSALIKADTEAMSRILTSDFLRTPPGGAATDKPTYVELVRSGRLKYISIDRKDVQYRVYGDTVVVNCTAPIRTSGVSGRTSDTELRLISVWVRQSGRWMLAAIQGTDVPGRRPVQ